MTAERGAVYEASVHFTGRKSTQDPSRLSPRHRHRGHRPHLAGACRRASQPGRRGCQKCRRDHCLVGLSPNLEGEEMPVRLDGFSGGDRTSIALPAAAGRSAESAGATGKPLIVVMQNGSALAVDWAQHTRTPSLRPGTRRRGRNRHRRDPGRRQRSRWPPAPHFLRVGLAAAALRRLLDERPHLPATSPPGRSTPSATGSATPSSNTAT